MISKKNYLFLFIGLQPFSFSHSYSIPEDTPPYIENLSPYESSFLRNNTPVSVIGILVEDKNGIYKLKNDSPGKNFSLPLEIAPSIKFDKKLLNKKVKANGRLTYKTMYFPDQDSLSGPAYSFKFELYTIASMD